MKMLSTPNLSLGLLAVLNVEVLEGVTLLALGEDAEVIAETLLLEVLLGEVLEVLLAVLHGGGDVEGVADEVDLDLVAKLALLAVELNLGLEVLLEAGEGILVHNLVLGGDAAVDLEDLLTLGEGLGADESTGTDLLADSDHLK